MHLKTIMARLGHPKHSDSIYTLLSKSTIPLSVSDIAVATKVSRVVVYRCLDSLATDELVVGVEHGKRTFYTVGSPEALMKAMRLTEAGVSALVEKEQVRKAKEVPAHVRFLYGSEGITQAFNDVVDHMPKGGTVYRYTSEQSVDEVNAYLAPDYRTRRDAKKLERLVISNPLSKAQKRSRLERFIRCIPGDTDIFDQNIIELIYGDRVSFIDVTKKQVTIIENKALADFQKVIFKQLYQKLPRD